MKDTTNTPPVPAPPAPPLVQVPQSAPAQQVAAAVNNFGTVARLGQTTSELLG